MGSHTSSADDTYLLYPKLATPRSMGHTHGDISVDPGAPVLLCGHGAHAVDNGDPYVPAGQTQSLMPKLEEKKLVKETKNLS